MGENDTEEALFKGCLDLVSYICLFKGLLKWLNMEILCLVCYVDSKYVSFFKIMLGWTLVAKCKLYGGTLAALEQQMQTKQGLTIVRLNLLLFPN